MNYKNGRYNVLTWQNIDC